MQQEPAATTDNPGNSTMKKDRQTLAVQLHAIRYETAAINTYELRAADGAALPRFTAGAHVDLHLPNGLVRSYSLCNDPDETHCYVLGVNHDPASRGGSRYVHEALRVGMTLTISAPQNDFPLFEAARHTVFIAGGIGITPILSMIRRLDALERSWELHYCTRTPETTAFLETLRGYGPRVHVHHDGTPDGKRLDIAALFAQHDAETHFYCCGPVPMLDAFNAATVPFEDEARFHVEYFAAKEAPATAGGFTVQLARTGRSIRVEAGKTILETLQGAGVEVNYSCSQGVCGACETRVLEGIPEHRDMVLTKAERESNRSMMICCSGSKGDCLVLDL
jgi:tetrachlorobenzoquinone reductase